MLLSLPEVQEDLELNRRQTKLIKALEDDVLSQLRSRVRTNFERSDTKTSKQDEVLAKLRRTILEDDQTRRFSQLMLQFEGLYAIENEDFAKKLKLTDEQRTKIRRVRRADNPINALDLVDSIVADDQLDMWQESLGREFEFSDALMEYRAYYLARRGRNFRSPQSQ